MARNRVLSFVSQFSGAVRDSRTPTPTSSSPPNDATSYRPAKADSSIPPLQTSLGQHFAPDSSTLSPTPVSPVRAEFTPSPLSMNHSPGPGSPQSRKRSNSRPLSMVQAYNPPIMDVNEDTIPELQPIFTFLNNHANKLYQEGYFLKLDDQNTQGRPNPDRTWTECFAQLVGTVLSLWDAAELDAAGEHGEVLPKFINLTDASIKMIESLPTKSNDEQPLQNILSISTAGRNRYLLHFNSHHSLIQWTAGIRLSMFEHSTLQEAYTGALIAGKGKTLNNIHIIMDRAKVKTEDWVRVRFGAGVPWRRCWCVISPPDEKEYQKQQKEMRKRSPYDRSHIPNLKGDIKFYDTRIQGKKQKKAKPIASIADAFSAYAIYPQAKSLIDASTLIKIEGNITIHSDPPSSTEGFVFIMPEVHPAVTGFEMLLRYLFPTWDTFGLYGRPGRLVASVLDPRSLMFGMPKHKKYGYLEILDVNSLILTEGSTSWSEREWRRRLKELTGARMTAMEEDPKGHSRTASRRSARLSIGPGSGAPPSRPRVNFADDSSSVRSSRSLTGTHPGARTDSAPPAADRRRGSPPYTSGHARNSSDTPIDGPLPFRGPPGFDSDSASPSPVRGQNPQGRPFVNDLASTPERVSSEDERSPQHPPPRDFGNMERMQTPEPVHAPPAFSHGPSSRPAGKPYHSPELRRANSRLSSTTLAQLAKAGGVPASMDYYRDEQGRMSSEDSSGSRPGQGDSRGQGVAIPTHAAHASPLGMNANGNGSREVLNHPSGPPGTSPGLPVPANPSSQRSRSPLNQMSNSDPRGPSPSTFAHPPSGPYNPYQQPQQQQQMLPPQGPPPGGPLPPGPPSSHAGMSGPVGRKPLPQPQRQESDPASEYKLDNRGLAQVRPPGPDQRFTPPPNARGPHRQGTQTSDGSHYDDGSSTTTPDYASTRSADTQESIERPRAGVLKTVGDDSQSQNANRDPHAEYGIPEIDFGRTVNYGASASAIPRNKTPTLLADGGRTLTLGNTHSRQESDDTIRRNVAWQPSGAGAVSPNDRSGALSPEQYVQQRAAAAAAMPHYTHARSPSGNTLAGSRNNTPTPPLMKRRSSFDMLNPKGLHSRSNSADLLGQRPSSQGAPSALGMAGSGDISSQLSAREQEHVARITGGPLISMAGNRDAPQNAGLVGAIGAREREKQQIKQGVSSALVENAISHRQQMQEREYRQQQQQHHQFMQPQRPQQQQQPMYGMAAPMGPPSGAPSMFGGSQGMRMGGGPMGGQIGGPMGGPMPMGSPGGGGRGYMPGPGYGPPQGRPSPQMHSPHGSPHPGAHVYAQGGGFSRPWPRQGGGGPPQQGMPPQGIPPQVMQQQHYQQGPPQGFGPGGFIPPPQGQRSPGPRVGTPNGMARGAPPPYQGQAF